MDATELFIYRNDDQNPIREEFELGGLVLPYHSMYGLPVVAREGDGYAENIEKGRVLEGERLGTEAEPLPAGMVGLHWRGRGLWLGVGEGRGVLLPYRLAPIDPPAAELEHQARSIWDLLELVDGTLGWEDARDEDKEHARRLAQRLWRVLYAFGK